MCHAQEASEAHASIGIAITIAAVAQDAGCVVATRPMTRAMPITVAQPRDEARAGPTARRDRMSSVTEA